MVQVYKRRASLTVRREAQAYRPLASAPRFGCVDTLGESRFAYGRIHLREQMRSIHGRRRHHQYHVRDDRIPSRNRHRGAKIATVVVVALVAFAFGFLPDIVNGLLGAAGDVQAANAAIDPVADAIG